MKIKETIERICCKQQDLKPIEGTIKYKFDYPLYVFCVHCGRQHMAVGFTDASGDSDWEYRPQPWPWSVNFK